MWLRIACLLSVLFSFSNVQSKDILTFPDYVISGVETRVLIDSQDSVVTISGNTFNVQSTDEESRFIEMTFESSNSYDFSGYTHNSIPKVIPAWWAVIPPLIAISDGTNISKKSLFPCLQVFLSVRLRWGIMSME
jgi:hypothetical protein